MDIITTSLEALIQRATSVHNQGPDTAAIEAFCGLINKEPECTQAASKFIIAKAHSLKEWEALQALLVLENCMKKCGVWFHSEVGKFRFLNELIKLVSPKYLGAHTADSVKRRVLDLMATWSNEFPNQSKIKEAYTMLKKQGVVQESDPPPAVVTSPAPTVEPRERTSSIFQDEEKSHLLQKLLRSSNPVDLQAANRLIKTMVKEDEKRVEEKWRRRVELETVVNNCTLLREMLCCYENGTSSAQDRELINELHTTCANLRPVLIRLANNPDPAFTCDVLSANDELGEVLVKYKEVMSGRPPLSTNQPSSLLDLTSPDRPLQPSLPQVSNSITNISSLNLGEDVSLLEENVHSGVIASPAVQAHSSNLDDILGLVPSSTPANIVTTSSLHTAVPQPSHCVNKSVTEVAPPPKAKGLEELDLLGENMLKEILSNSGRQHISKRNLSKVSMNELLLNGGCQNEGGDRSVGSSEPVLEDISGRLSPPMPTNAPGQCLPERGDGDASLNSRGDEPLLNLGDISSTLSTLSLGQNSASSNHQSQLPISSSEESSNTLSKPETNESDDVNLLGSPVSSHHQESPQTPVSLASISVSIDTIKPSRVPPWTAVSDSEGLTIVVTLASDRPRPDVSVFVVTTTNRSKQALTNFELKPILPKRCKGRLLEPSTTSLPGFNPFLPPAAIVQILLIASYSMEPVNLKLVINYVMDEEPVTDIAQVDQLLLVE